MQAFMDSLTPETVAALGNLAATRSDQLQQVLDAVASDMDSMAAMATDIPPTAEPVTDYVTDLETRCDLFQKFRTLAMRSHLSPNAAMLGFFMVAPVEQLQVFLQTCETRARQAEPFLLGIDRTAPFAMRAFLPKGRPDTTSQDGPIYAPPSAILGPLAETNRNRGKGVADSVSNALAMAEQMLMEAQVKARDGHRCVFSGLSNPCAAHIFPHATSREKDFPNLNTMLLHLWGPKQQQVWAQKYQDFSETETARNELSMNFHLHHWFDNAKFALKPLHQTDNSITVQWHWLKPTGFTGPKDTLKPGESITSILDKAGLTEKSWGMCLAHRESGLPIRTGQTFTIRAEDPKDVPSWDLLNLSWNLLRVAAICGAANVTDDEYYFTPDDDDDDDDYVYEYTTAATEEYDMTAGRDATWQQVPILAEEQAKELASEEACNEDILVTVTGEGASEEGQAKELASEEACKEDTPVTVTGEGASEEDDGHGKKASKWSK